MRSLIGSLVCLAGFASHGWAFLPPAYDDAPLRAVRFVDRTHGVAVGDHGVVWVTLNGGNTWDRMKSGTKASLRAVHFVDPFHGWAVGRTELSGNAGSSGTVLGTVDGGLTWAELNATSLPGLNVVHFFDEKLGVAAGDGTPSHPSGLFATSDGGKTWLPIAGPRTTSWTCAHFSNMSTGMLGGLGSQLNGYSKGVQKPVDTRTGGRSVRGFACDDAGGVAVGDGGLILRSTDGCASWTTVGTGLSGAVADCLDFRCVSRVGNVMWAAGRPGSVVLKSTDAGTTWSACRTGWTAPLHAVCAVSESEVWAVGEFGAILCSTDGGQKWTVQRCGGQRATVLFTHADPRNVPMETVAAVGGRDGYFAAALGITSTDPQSTKSDRNADEFRLAAAARLAGGAAGECEWQFPVPTHLGVCDPKTLLAAWDQRHSGKASDALVRRLVLAMRIWSPEVVVSDELSNAVGPAEQLVLTALQQAFKMAEDPNAFPEQITELGLKPVAPKRLYCIAPDSMTDAPVKYDTTLFAKTLVNTVQGHAEAACAVLGEAVYPPNSRCYRLVSHRMPGCERHAELTHGLDLAEGGTARRKLPDFGPSLDGHFKQAQEFLDTRRMLDGLLRSADTTIGMEKAMALAAESLRKLPDDLACRTAVALARQLAAQGKWVPARELYLIAVARYGTFPESAGAVRWLARYYASSEARMRADKEHFVVMQYGGPTAAGPAGVQQTSASEMLRYTNGEATQAWCRACMEMETRLKAFGPAYTRDPETILATLSARRQLGLVSDSANTVKAYFATTAGAKEVKPGTDFFRDCLAAELWLDDRSAVPTQPKPFVVCPKVSNKPFLDGKLTDDCWTGLKPIEASIVGGEMTGYGTKAYFGYDDECLYFAVACTHPEGKSLPKAEARRRDDDLRGKDRVDLLLDLDRDFQSYYRLQVDQRGCVAEDCWGDTGWNPKWFVAVEPTPTGWTAEIAIPRAELDRAMFRSGSTWGMNVTRVVPGVGCQTWSGPPATTPTPAGMGLMQFLDEKK